MEIRSDREKVLSNVELGRKYHMDPRTAERFAESPQKPEYTLSEPKPTKKEPFYPDMTRCCMTEFTMDRLWENLESIKMKNTLEILDNYLERATVQALNDIRRV